MDLCTASSVSVKVLRRPGSARERECVCPSRSAFRVMLPCEFQGILIHGMSSNGHRKISRPAISSSRKTVAPKNRSRAMLQDRLATHPRPWASDPRCQLQSCSQILSADREIHWILVYYESHRTFCMDFVQESVTWDQYMKT